MKTAQFRNTKKRYGLVAIALHWLAAVWIIALFVLGLYMVDLGYYDDLYKTGPYLHKAMGVILALVMLARFVWRISNPKPEIAGSAPVKKAAEAAHTLMYLWVGAVICSGYLISTADGRAIDVFGWFSIPASVTGLANQEDIAGLVHLYLAIGLISLALLHALAAIKHQFLDKDGTLGKMLRTS